MLGIVNTLDAFFDDYFGINIPNVSVTDIIEIIIITYFIYRIMIWFKNSRAWNLFRGILVILMLFGVAAMFQMHTILWIGEKLISVGLMAILIVFQPELRHALDELGRHNITAALNSLGRFKNTDKRFEDSTISGIVSACYEMGAVKTGALIVIEKEQPLTEFERTGIPMDSIVSRQLLINIFEKNTPLHDGAIIIKGDRVAAATCYLPLSDNMELSKELGTRHRAAVGVSEVSDAVTIVVSEETGKVSLTKNGMIYRNLTDEDLLKELKLLQHYDMSWKEGDEAKSSKKKSATWNKGVRS